MGEWQDIVLRVYRAESGQWSGILLDDDDEEIGRVSGCLSPDDVQDAAIDAGMNFVRVEIMLDGRKKSTYGGGHKALMI